MIMQLLCNLQRLQRQQILMKGTISADIQEIGVPKIGTHLDIGQAQREQRRHPSLITIPLPDRNQRHSHQNSGMVETRMTNQLSNRCGVVTVGTHGRSKVGKMVINKTIAGASPAISAL